MNENQKLCKNCRWSKKSTPDLKDLSATIRQCLYNPPYPVMIPTSQGPMIQTYNPVVDDNNYCSRFEPKLSDTH